MNENEWLLNREGVTQIEFHDELDTVEKQKNIFSVLENKLNNYKGQFVITSETGFFYSEIMCLCGTPHITVYKNEETANNEVKTMPKYYQSFKNAKVHQISNKFFADYKNLLDKLTKESEKKFLGGQ